MVAELETMYELGSTSYLTKIDLVIATPDLQAIETNAESIKPKFEETSQPFGKSV